MTDEEITALNWFAMLIYRAETSTGNTQALLHPGDYTAGVFNRFAAHPDLTRKVVAEYRMARDANELDCPLWARPGKTALLSKTHAALA